MSKRCDMIQIAVISVFLMMFCDVYGQQEFNSVFQECNQTIREGQGVIMSPDFSTNYPNNLHCRWNIEVESDRIVRFTFGYFGVEGGVNCQFDSVSVYNGPSTDHPLLGKFCGPFLPGKQVSTANKMLITMDTDKSTSKRGFYGFFMSDTPELATEGSCGGLMRDVEGSFHSPNYPKSNYPGSVTCSWHIRVREDNVILLSIEDFDIEKSSGCKYDFVVIYGGWSYSDKTKFIGRFCGDMKDIPQTITSPGNELFITFVSDTSGFAAGFSASYASKRKLAFDSGVSLTTTPTAVLKTSKTTTPVPVATVPPFECPTECPSKIKAKTRICSANYVAVIRLTSIKTLRAESLAPAEIIKSFKHGSLPEISRINIRIACRRCSNMNRKGSYLIAGGTITDEGIEIRPGDLVMKYKERKHTKQVAKLLKKCRKGRRRKGKRSSPDKKGKVGKRS